MTVLIHGKSKDETLAITSKTRIFVDKKPGILADIKEGENVVAEYHNTKEKTKEALTLRLGGPAAPEPKAEAKPATKKPTKKATARKPARKKTPPTDNAAPAPAGDTGITPLPTPDAGAVVPPGTTPAPAPAPGTPGANP